MAASAMVKKGMLKAPIKGRALRRRGWTTLGAVAGMLVPVLGGGMVPAVAHAQTATDCGPHLLTYAAATLAGNSLGIRCVRLSRYGSRDTVWWYGEGRLKTGSFRQVGFVLHEPGWHVGRVADITGNGEARQLKASGVALTLSDTSASPAAITLSGPLRERWTRRNAVVHQPLPPLQACGPHFTRYYVYRNPADNVARGTRCALDVPAGNGGFVFVGAGNWGSGPYLHLGLMSWEIGGGEATDLCGAFGAHCSQVPPGGLQFGPPVPPPGGIQMAGAWDETWRTIGSFLNKPIGPLLPTIDLGRLCAQVPGFSGCPAKP